MQASIGDRIIVRGHQLGVQERCCHVLAVEGPEGAPPYRVRWEDDAHESVFVPGPDALIEHRSMSQPEQPTG
jgi:hypothetical protein